MFIRGSQAIAIPVVAELILQTNTVLVVGVKLCGIKIITLSVYHNITKMEQKIKSVEKGCVEAYINEISKSSEFDTDYTDDIVCPYCGRKYLNSCEHGGVGSDEWVEECDSCGNEFLVSRVISVTYKTNV